MVAGYVGVMREKEMSQYNKIVIASQMFERSHEIFESAQSDIDYTTSIMLSGAVIGIVAPLLLEQEGLPTHNVLSKIQKRLYPEEQSHSGLFRETYNALKHAGNNREKVKASDDLEFEANLAQEAARMLDAAKSDFKEITASNEIRKKVSNSFIDLLESEREYA